jgi:hypothetical protein
MLVVCFANQAQSFANIASHFASQAASGQPQPASQPSRSVPPLQKLFTALQV